MIGKYSPTVSRAYTVNQDWFKEEYERDAQHVDMAEMDASH
jgi:hypothetical protein